MPRAIVVIGGGPAGTYAAIAAKKQDPSSTVTLLTLEHCEPYEKPPLSKAVLLGTVSVDDALIAGPPGVGGHDVVLQTWAHCINAQRDLAVARRLIERRVSVDAAALADPAQPLTAMLKR